MAEALLGRHVCLPRRGRENQRCLNLAMLLCVLLLLSSGCKHDHGLLPGNEDRILVNVFKANCISSSQDYS